MSRRALITGGAGFIGAYVADDLLAHGYDVRVLDALLPQVHGPERMPPAYLDPDVELIEGDVRDPDVVHRALHGIDVVVHLAASVGVGPSMYEIADYTSVNNLGTAVLLEQVVERPIERLVVASSMSVYGEGLYRDDRGALYDRLRRTPEQLARAEWDPRTPDGRPLTAVPTPETKPPSLGSVYALSKYDQERMCLMVGSAYKIPTVALRLFNVYGPRQALSNPYTGVLAILSSRLLADKAPRVFEDGRQLRDFVHVRDVATACRRALEVDAAAGGVFNVGSGRAISILEIAQRLGRVLGRERPAELTGEYRAGDIRHCTADVELARRVLGFEASVDLDDGLRELAGWLARSQVVDHADVMRADLARVVTALRTP